MQSILHRGTHTETPTNNHCIGSSLAKLMGENGDLYRALTVSSQQKILMKMHIIKQMHIICF